jgi:hypothetical protein
MYMPVLSGTKTLRCFTAIDPATSWPEIVEITDKRSQTVMDAFHKCSPTTSYNPQGKSIIERIHQVMGNMLRAFELEDRELDPDDPWNEFLQACAFAIRSTFHTTLQASPGQLVFGRDMIHDIQFEANWNRIKNNKEKNIATSNIRKSMHRRACAHGRA